LRRTHGAAVEVVARTGEVEAVGVLDLGPRNESMNRGPGDRVAGRTSAAHDHQETNMESVYGSMAGIEVYKKMLAVVIRPQPGEQAEYEKRKFGATRAEIQHRKAWLRAQGVSEVVLQGNCDSTHRTRGSTLAASSAIRRNTEPG
jgi:hypothetical protein